MSVDPSSHSSTQAVTSKYFSGKSGMDESLSDFQEKKKIAAPKATKPKPKTKKASKRPKGQKDIRTVLKSKKSELVAYAKDFDNVCKQAGIDVDSEQLQLAIALSKSVEPSTSESEGSQVSSQDRTAKIRSTLQEYGFTVPEIKISSTNRKLKKQRKNYKLLLQSETERQQNIADKYSQVLLQNIHHTCSPKKKVECNNSGTKLFSLTTNVPYETIRDNNLYYLENLPLEKSSPIGSLLKDWSEIPGRPVSPKPSKDLTMDVSEILCSQEEINTMLSGTLKTAKNLIRNKFKACRDNRDRNEDNRNKDKEILNVDKKCDKYNRVSNLSHVLIDEREVECENKSSPTKVISETVRSCSPDLFDDEPSSCHDGDVNIDMHVSLINIPHKETVNKSIILPTSTETKHPVVSSQSQLSQNVTKRKSNDVMELTECVDVNLNPSSSIIIRTDYTKRKSDDFMELTECVVLEKVCLENNIDLTQNSHENVSGGKNNEDMEIKDLTQSSSSNDTLPVLPVVHVSGKNNESLDNTVVLDVSELNVINRSPGKEDISMEATSGDNSCEVICNLIATPPKKSINIEESSHDSFFEEFVYNHSHSPEQNDTIEKSIPYWDDNDGKIDLTQSPKVKGNKINRSVSQMENKHNTEVELKEIPEQSSNTENSLPELENNCEIDLTQSPIENDNTKEKSYFESENSTDIDLTCSPKNQDTNKSFKYEVNDKDRDKVDLTQNSSGSEIANIEIFLDEKLELFNKSSLGKQGDVSIDYDDLCTSNASSGINKTVIYEITNKLSYKVPEVENNSHSSNKSLNSSDKNCEKINKTHTSEGSEVFELSDRELNYSMHQSRYEDCFEVNFGGISVVDSNSSNRNGNLEQEEVSEDHDSNKYISDSFLPEVNVKNHETAKEMPNLGLSPIKNDAFHNFIETPNCNKSRNAMHDIVKTPGNREYVIKTDQVTPMGDYMAMSTPERNKELEKYGLKPLKRKRAIQLLTHIYIQTHPLVEPCTSEVGSPTKKRKTDSTPTTSPRKSPRKNTATKIPNISPRKIRTKHITVNERSPIKKQSSSKNIMSPINNVEINENIYEVTNERVEIRNIECGEDEWVFQKREKAKLNSCRVPLHIAFHNYVSCRRGLREAILRYEPVEIDVIHKDLAASGHRYDPKDLLKFLDKKCITVKTVDNNARNIRK